MTKEDISKLLQSGTKLSKPQLRELDFMIRRVGSEADANRAQDPMTRGLEDMGEPLSLGEQRLQQLHLFRKRKQEQAAQLLADTEGDVSSRDMFESGKINWLPIGPAGVERGQASNTPIVSGRAKGIAIAPGGNRVYIATANGGAWYSGDGGQTWQPLLDQENFFPDASGTIGTPNDTDSLACGAIALVPGLGRNTDRIYLGTGEGAGQTFAVFGQTYAYLGVGVLVSNNGGTTWTREEADISADATLKFIGHGFYALAVDPDDSERVIGGTSNGIYVRAPKLGGGYEWKMPFMGLKGQRVTGLLCAKGRAGKKFFASVWGDKVYASDDGNTWTPLGTNFPTGRIGRMSLGVHPHNTDVVYVMIALEGAGVPKDGFLKGIYRFDATIDNKWYRITGNTPAETALINSVFGKDDLGGQGDYDNCLVVAPNNVNRIYIGGSIAYADANGRVVPTTDNGQWSGALYRCDIKATKTGAIVTVKAKPTYIGGSLHGDLHSLVFTPNEPDKLWVGSDGGIFKTNHARTGSGMIFESKNIGLQTLTINHMDVHPTLENIVFCGAQDCGGLRYTGESVWLHTAPGDGGRFVINWQNPYQVISTYVSSTLRRNNRGGNRAAAPDFGHANDEDKSIVLTNEFPRFYAPLVGVPYKAGLPAAQANIIAFGGQRPWVSTNFGDSWRPLPSRNAASVVADMNRLGNGTITALAFVDSKTLLVGMDSGRVYRYRDTSAANNWTTVNNTPDFLNDPSVSAAMPANAVSDFAVNPDNPKQFYITLGGTIGGANGHQHVWFYNQDEAVVADRWKPKSGAGVTALLDMHFNAIVVNPQNPIQVFAGSDVGVWMSPNGGNNWETFSFGLPETAVIDLRTTMRDINGVRKVFLRTSTYGRGLFEAEISDGVPNTPDIKLYLRGTFLDRGYYPIELGMKDPRDGDGSTTITDINTPDIKIDTPKADGTYQFANSETLSMGQFYLYDEETKPQNILIPATDTATTRVYVQVNSRGILHANNVQVMLLLKEGTAAALPNLPTNFQNDLKSGSPITADGWKTIGIRTVHGVSAGVSQVVRFDLSSDKIATHVAAAGGKDFILVALLHHAQDAFADAPSVIINTLVRSDERKVMFKHIKAVQNPAIPAATANLLPLAGFVQIPETATAPEAPFDAFLGLSFRLNDDLFNNLLAARLAQPISNRGGEVMPPSLDTRSFYRADTIEVNQDIAIQDETALIWFAREKITISKTIDAKGKGASSGIGDFGGAGGGSATNVGKGCTSPLSNPPIVMASGGGTGANKVGTDVSPDWASRLPLFLAVAKGGAAGGDDSGNKGGLGGGIVVLCAPIIEFTADGKIDASGNLGAGNAGGGGGGIILLIAGEIINPITEGATANLIVEGGNSAGTGGKGGKGLLIMKKYVG